MDHQQLANRNRNNRFHLRIRTRSHSAAQAAHPAIQCPRSKINGPHGCGKKAPAVHYCSAVASVQVRSLLISLRKMDTDYSTKWPPLRPVGRYSTASDLTLSLFPQKSFGSPAYTVDADKRRTTHKKNGHGFPGMNKYGWAEWIESSTPHHGEIGGLSHEFKTIFGMNF